MATVQEILDNIKASTSNNLNNNSFIELMQQISGNPEDAISPANDTNSIYGHIVQMYTELFDGLTDYEIVVANIDTITEVFNNLDTINSVDDSKAVLESIFADKSKLDSIFANKITLDSLYTDKATLDSLFADKIKFDRIYSSIANIDRIHQSIDNVDNVIGEMANIDTVASSIGSVNATAAIDAEVMIVANNTTDISTLADDIDKINEIYTNRAEIYSADDNAVIATAKASEASTSAAEALVSKNATEVARLAVESIYDTFDDRFLGTKTVDPTVDNDGDALTDGALYFNTSSNVLKVYDTGTTTWYQLPQVYLSALLDVELSSITTGDILVWNGTKWSNTADPKVDSIQFNGGIGDEGTLSWNSDEGTLDLVANSTTLQVGQETYINVKNQTGSTISDGTVVMAAGTVGASGRILVQPYDGVSLPKYILGIATESISDGEDGKITTFGKIRGLDTSAWSEGDELFVTTNGGLTNIEPVNGINIAIAYVINSDANNGTIMVRFTPYDENLSYTKDESDTNLATHTDLVNNPHSVTKLQVGLGNVDNTSDANKPVSLAQQTALDLKTNKADLVTAIGNINSPILDLPLKDSLAYSVGNGYINYECDTTSTYIDKYGVLQYAEVDEPRFEKEGLLIEGESTNLMLNSNEYTLWTRGAMSAYDNTGVTSPDGVSLSSKVVSTEGSTNSYMLYYLDSITDVDKTYTASVFLKKGTNSFITVYFGSQNDWVTQNLVYVDFDSKLAVSGTGLPVTFIELADGWFRLSMTATKASSESSSYLRIQYADTLGIAATNPVVADSYTYVWGVQLEEMPFATSYIPTTDTTVTRGVNRCWIDQSNMPETNTESTNFSISLDYNVFGSVNTSQILIGQYYSSANYWYIRNYSYDTRVSCISESGNVSTSITTGDSNLDYDETRRFLLTVSNKEHKIFQDGLLKHTSTRNTDAMTDNLKNNELIIGALYTTYINPMYGHISNIRIWDKALTDTEGAMA